MGRDKAGLRHPATGDLTLVEHTVAVLRTRCDPVFVVASPGQRLPALSAEVLVDEIPDLGPLPATGRGLRAAALAGADRAFVSAVDMPYLSADVVDLVAGGSGADLVLPWDGRDHYLSAVYRTALADRIEALVAAGSRSMRALTETVSVERVVFDRVAASALTNWNEPTVRE